MLVFGLIFFLMGLSIRRNYFGAADLMSGAYVAPGRVDHRNSMPYRMVRFFGALCMGVGFAVAAAFFMLLVM
ncbi:hypothetical protein SAMN05192584_105213 [Streptomyces pini]|uniref:Uncharacterized protein n=1 Tax=Streptomyces pini TaxID=1520580 RepID=A0A1I3YUZ2_9ACTN|nr:hypothetical protein SAMN05192584_105213 [Streptomyces pini]